MIGRARALVRRLWPRLRLRTILFAVLLFSAAMPGLGALFLRVYENTLVRQTEAELAAQAAALAITAETFWPGAIPVPLAPGPLSAEAVAGPTIDLSSSPVLPERPKAAVGPTADPAALLTAQTLYPIFERTRRETLASLILLDRNGVVVIGGDAGGSFFALPEVHAALNGRSTTVLREIGAYEPRYSLEWLSRASNLRIHHARPVMVNGKVEGVVLASRTARALFRGLYQDRGKIGLGVAIIFSVLVLLTALVARGVARPIERLSRAARDVAAGKGEIPPTPATAAIEIRALYEEFTAMESAISRRSRYLKDFAAAVSHEFKTPLAGISGAIEILQDHEMSKADRDRFLRNISAGADRLTQLVTRLLDLARADMAQPELGVATDVAAAVDNAGAVADGLEVTIDLPLLPKVAVPAATIETVLKVLLDNSRQAGATRVRISADVDDTVRLTVEDNGPGVPASDQEKIFELFFTHRRAEGGTGLGLPIARSLLAASGGAIVLRPGKGAAFEVGLPLAA